MITYDMWFSIEGGQRFKITVNGPDSGTVMELARLNWDFNVKMGMLPASSRP